MTNGPTNLYTNASIRAYRKNIIDMYTQKDNLPSYLKHNSSSLHSLLFWCFIALFIFGATSCKEVVVEYDCGEVDTEIVSIHQAIGSFQDSMFNTNIALEYDQAAIRLLVDEYHIVTPTEHSCFSFTPLPQRIENIEISSSEAFQFGGTTYAAGDNLIDAFQIYSDKQWYSIANFIAAHQNEPVIFHGDEDQIILQLHAAPDITFSQNFSLRFNFDDGAHITVQIPLFSVMV